MYSKKLYLSRGKSRTDAMKKIVYVICLLGLLVVTKVQAQFNSKLSFTRIGLEEGLSQSTVLDIVQDSQGCLWFATQDGLNKYNGYDFTVYRHDSRDTATLASDFLYALDIDTRDRIWVGTEAGLSCYDARLDAFRNYSLHEGSDRPLAVTHVAIVDSLHLLALAGNRLYAADARTGLLKPVELAGLSEVEQYQSLTHRDSLIYIGTDKGLYVYFAGRGKAEKYPFKELEGQWILTALLQVPSYLWVATEGMGLYRFDLSDGTVRHYTAGTDRSIGSDYVRSLTLDRWNRLWVGTFTSLNIYHQEDDTFEQYVSDPANPASLSQTSVRCLYRDQQGGMWLGTYFGGLNYYHEQKNRFRSISRMPGRNSLNNNVISCIVEDEKKNLWIGTNGGLNLYEKERGLFHSYTTADGLLSNDIKAVSVDELRQEAYIGSHAGGFSILHVSDGRIENFMPSGKTIDGNSVYTITPKGKDELWVSTVRTVKRFDKRSRKFADCPMRADGKSMELAEIQLFFEDSKQRIWISDKESLHVFRVVENALEQVDLLPAGCGLERKKILCIREQANRVYWLGTRDGLYRFDEAKGEVTRYSTADGLPNNVVYGILEDSYRNLWLSTNGGLSRFTPQLNTFRNYTSSDGLQSDQFTPYAYCHTADGQMYFGGVNGLTAFYPDQLVDNPYTPSVIFTELRLFNQTVRPGDATGILKEAIGHTKCITLQAGQSMFSLDFVVSNYIAGNHNTFAYKLEGYDADWTITHSLRTVSYSNLPQGHYRFLVKAANNDGIWNDRPTELEIVVLPVWYKTWWAKLLFLLAFAGGVTLVFRHFWIRKMMEARIELERIDKERQKEVNEMKLRFFINISHELRTPLTLITAPLQELQAKVQDRWMSRQLEHIRRNTDRLLHLVNQLMDYRRAELGVFHLKVRLVAIRQTIEKNFLFYERLAQQKQITYRFDSDLGDKEVLCDPEYLELIENNLLSNAFKYTGEGKSIIVTLRLEGEELMLQVRDTGMGIPLGKQDKIFERFYQVDSEHPGSGIGLSLVQRLVELHHGTIRLDSREGEGSTFTVRVPAMESAYTVEERQRAEEEVGGAHTTNRQEMYMVDTEDEPGGAPLPDEDGAAVPREEKRKETILVVEDNADIRRYLAEELGTRYQVAQAGNGEEALNRMKEQPVDLVLTDVMMPVMDGLHLCRAIKQNMNTCHIPVIILSAKADVREQLEGLQVGADDYIPKPFVLDIVLAKIRNLFRTRYRAIEHYSKSMEIEPEKIALNPLDEQLLKQAMDIMERHLDDVDFTTDEFAREMCMSRSSLHAKMKALTGESTNDFIRKVRFNRACKLLKEGRYTVAEISTMVGYNTPSYFTTCFKKYFGCLPSEYGK